MRASINSATMVRQEVTELVEVLTNRASINSATMVRREVTELVEVLTTLY